MLPKINRDKVAYNRRVLAELRKTASHHADELEQRGNARGWWDQINYFRVTYKTPAQAARSIEEIRLYDGAR